MTNERIQFCMDFISGGSLNMILKHQKVFPESRIKFYAIQMIIGLGILHENNIMHRDVKLDNLMIDETGYLKVIDFGLARIINPGQKAYTYCGSLAYMAPEVLSGEPYDYSAEWWSVGIVLYEMMSGFTPFASKQITTMNENIMNG